MPLPHLESQKLNTQRRFSEICARISELRLSAAEWKRDSPDPAVFMPAFADHADCIVEDAERLSDDALDAAHQLIDEILIGLGYQDVAHRQT